MPNSPFFIPNPDLYPDPSGRAQRMIDFVSMLTIWEGEDFAGQPFKVHPFQSAIIKRIYGPCRDDGSRLVRIACVWLPRGNAKTTLAAALGLGHFLGPEAESGGQIIAAAADRENAGIAFNSGLQFIRQDDVLAERVRPIESRKIIHHRRTNGVFKAISTEAYSKHGLNVSFFLADEIHAWPPTEARKLWKVVTDSMVKRKNPLTIVISTAGEGVGSLGWDMWDYSMRVAKGEIDDPSFAPIIFGVDAKEDWTNPKVWRKANPAIEAGFLYEQELIDKVKRAKYFPTDAFDFKRFHLNIWMEGSATPWIEIELYDQADEITPIEALRGEKCWIGIDLSSVEDLTAVVAVFPDELNQTSEAGEIKERGFDILPMFFLPRDNLARKSDLDQAQYIKWAEEGYLTLTEGNRIDYKVVEAYCESLYADFDVQEEVIDRWNSAAFVTNRQDKNREIIEFGQGFASMAAPVKQIKSSILGKKFRHGKNPILRMNFQNVVTEKDAAENEKFTKAKARGRIDGATAAAQAIGRILEYEAEQLEDSYRGVYSKPSVINQLKNRKEKQEEQTLLVTSDTKWSSEILADHSHPDYEEHKKRFFRWQDRQARLEGAM